MVCVCRIGDKDVDAVMLTAHDKFNDILQEAQKGDSIFKAGNVIKVEEIEPEQVTYTQLEIETDDDQNLHDAYTHTNVERTDATDTLIKTATELITTEVTQHIQKSPGHTVTAEQAQQIVETVKQKVTEDKDLADVFHNNENQFTEWMKYKTEEVHRAAESKFIHIPRIKGEAIDFEDYNPKKVILEQLRKKAEIDYEKCFALLFKLITQVCDHYKNQYGQNGMQNIVMMYKRDIGNKIYSQMLQHFYCENGFLQEEVVGTRNYNLQQSYTFSERVNLYAAYAEKIQSMLFDGIKRGVFSTAKFDSTPELVLARVLENDGDVQNWLRPAPRELNITYNRGSHYEPDFVVETDGVIYLVEVKGEDKLNDPDVIAKKKAWYPVL